MKIKTNDGRTIRFKNKSLDGRRVRNLKYTTKDSEVYTIQGEIYMGRDKWNYVTWTEGGFLLSEDNPRGADLELKPQTKAFAKLCAEEQYKGTHWRPADGTIYILASIFASIFSQESPLYVLINKETGVNYSSPRSTPEEVVAGFERVK